LTPDQGITWGSLSIQNGGMQIRQAAATAREALLAQVASVQGLAREILKIKDGVIAPTSGDKSWSYAELVGGRELHLKLDPKAPLKDPKNYTIVGKPVARLDIPGKVTGQFTYMQDFSLKGMIHARVIRPSAVKAVLLAWSDDKARVIPGYLGAVRKENFLAVLGANEWAAIKASRAVEAKWSDWQGLPEKGKLWEYVRDTNVVNVEDVQKVGDSAAGMKTKGARVVSAVYDFAIHTHGSIGPSCAVAQYQDGKLTVWSASQQTHLLRKQLSNMLAVQPEDIRCIYIEGAGCYGRNGHEDAAADAALLAKEAGRPVRVQWMRQDEHGWDPKGPPTLIDVRAALDAGNDVLAWESEAFLPYKPKESAVTLLAAELAGLPRDEAFPGNISQSLGIPYTVPNIRATVRWLAQTPLRPSWIRAPGRMQNTFANESFVDELAATIGVDPLEFRLRSLNDPRGAELLRRLATLSGWTARRPATRPAGSVARGRGLAYVHYELYRTYVGAVADVEVDGASGKVTAKKFYIAHDCGQIINPDGLRNQIEGNIVQTTSRTLLEELQFDRSRVTSVDWATYPILKFPDVPEVAIELIDRPTEKPWGAGEPAAAVVPAAIANAIFDATGARLRSVPMTPAKVLAALHGARPS
jgi:CO/xanthine dehydrogenase Mo-binding subunit